MIQRIAYMATAAVLATSGVLVTTTLAAAEPDGGAYFCSGENLTGYCDDATKHAYFSAGVTIKFPFPVKSVYNNSRWKIRGLNDRYTWTNYGFWRGGRWDYIGSPFTAEAPLNQAYAYL